MFAIRDFFQLMKVIMNPNLLMIRSISDGRYIWLGLIKERYCSKGEGVWGT